MPYHSPYSDSSFDTVMLFGPMYHLLEKNERKKASDEAIRVLKPNGYLFVSFISMYGGMVFEMRECPDAILSPIDQEVFYPSLLRNEGFSGRGFTLATFDTPKTMERIMDDSRLSKVTVFGQESVLAPCEDKIKSSPKNVRDMWIKEAIALAEREEFLSFAEHFCYVAKKVH